MHLGRCIISLVRVPSGLTEEGITVTFYGNVGERRLNTDRMALVLNFKFMNFTKRLTLISDMFWSLIAVHHHCLNYSFFANQHLIVVNRWLYSSLLLNCCIDQLFGNKFNQLKCNKALLPLA